MPYQISTRETNQNTDRREREREREREGKKKRLKRGGSFEKQSWRDDARCQSIANNEIDERRPIARDRNSIEAEAKRRQFDNRIPI